MWKGQRPGSNPQHPDYLHVLGVVFPSKLHNLAHALVRSPRVSSNVMRTHLVMTLCADGDAVGKCRAISHLVAFEMAEGHQCFAMVAVDLRILVQHLMDADRVRTGKDLVAHVARELLFYFGADGVMRSAVLSHMVVVAWRKVAAIDVTLLSLIDMFLDVLAPVRLLGRFCLFGDRAQWASLRTATLVYKMNNRGLLIGKYELTARTLKPVVGFDERAILSTPLRIIVILSLLLHLATPQQLH
jgi:hypothetical protein